MKCPACRQVSTFTHWFEEALMLTADLKIKDGKVVVDYATTEQKFSTEPDENPEKCECDGCRKEVRIADIEIVDDEDIKL